jgi:hypothetical protein
VAAIDIPKSNIANALDWLYHHGNIHEVLTMDGPVVLFWLLVLIVGIYSIRKFVAAFRIGIADETFPVLVGTYLTGLKGTADYVKDVKCRLEGNEFVFFSDVKGILGNIPRDGINEIVTDDKTRIYERITIPRAALVGIFSLGIRKQYKMKEWCLLIDWEEISGVHQNTIFEFSGKYCETLVNKAANTLRRGVKPKVNRQRPDEKKCPACAEVVKVDAKICRYCKTVLEQTGDGPSPLIAH